MRLSFILAALAMPALAAAQPDRITKLPGSLGVPSSPAFVLLSVKPDEVTHINTPSDLQANQALFFDGHNLRTGLALDGRLAITGVGSIADYQKSPAKQIWWRSVWSAGTTAGAKGTKDMLLAAGVRLPVIDRGDPRADKAFTDSLLKLAESAVPDIDLNTTLAQLKAHAALIAAATESLRKAKKESSWGAGRLDLGLGYSAKAANAAIKQDSLSTYRFGGWLAGSSGINHWLLVTGDAKYVTVHPDSATAETARTSAGMRFSVRPMKYFGLSLEGTAVKSIYGKTTGLDESWGHYAVVAEVPALWMDGWFTLAWGGDGPHRTQDKNVLSFSYAVFKDRVLK